MVEWGANLVCWELAEISFPERFASMVDPSWHWPALSTRCITIREEAGHCQAQHPGTRRLVARSLLGPQQCTFVCLSGLTFSSFHMDAETVNALILDNHRRRRERGTERWEKVRKGGGASQRKHSEASSFVKLLLSAEEHIARWTRLHGLRWLAVFPGTWNSKAMSSAFGWHV